MNVTCLTTEEREIDLEAMQAAYGVSDLTVLNVTLLREDGVGAGIYLRQAGTITLRYVTVYADGGWVQIEDSDGADLTDDEQQFLCTLTAHVIGLADGADHLEITLRGGDR